MILVGTLSKKIGLLKEEDVETLNNIVINMATYKGLSRDIENKKNEIINEFREQYK